MRFAAYKRHSLDWRPFSREPARPAEDVPESLLQPDFSFLKHRAIAGVGLAPQVHFLVACERPAADAVLTTPKGKVLLLDERPHQSALWDETALGPGAEIAVLAGCLLAAYTGRTQPNPTPA